MYLLIINEDRKLSRAKIEAVPTMEKVSELRMKAAEVANCDPEYVHLLHCGTLLKDDLTLIFYGVRTSSCVHVVCKPAVKSVTVLSGEEKAKVTDAELQQFTLSFGLAVRNPRFGKFVQRLAKRENLENLAAAIPGLDRDPIACSFLSKPELMLTLLHPETFKYIHEKHPGLIEAANHLAAAIHEEKPQQSSSSDDPTNPFAYHLDELSDEEDYEGMEMSPIQAASGRTPIAGPNQISAEQLRAAISAAQSSNSFFGPSLAAPSSSGSVPYPGSTSSQPSSASITHGQLTAALADVAASTSGTATPFNFGDGQLVGSDLAIVEPPAEPPSWEQEVAKMKEMGITDEGLARKALEVMGGDLQAAIELIFSGWDGMDDSNS